MSHHVKMHRGCVVQNGQNMASNCGFIPKFLYKLLYNYTKIMLYKSGKVLVLQIRPNRCPPLSLTAYLASRHGEVSEF
jgi:hypothetical protein